MRPRQAEQKGKDWFSQKDGTTAVNGGRHGLFPKSRKASTFRVSEVSGQHSHVRETDTELADLGQNNPAVPLPNCIALGIPAILPNPLLTENETSVSHRAYEESNEMMPVLRVMTTSGLYA